jgi:hypothetical protein
MKAYGEVDVLIHVFLSSVLVEGEWSASRSGRFTPVKRPVYLLDNRLRGLRSRSGRYEEVKILYPNGTLIRTYRSLNPKLVAIPTDLPRSMPNPLKH